MCKRHLAHAPDGLDPPGEADYRVPCRQRREIVQRLLGGVGPAKTRWVGTNAPRAERCQLTETEVRESGLCVRFSLLRSYFTSRMV